MYFTTHRHYVPIFLSGVDGAATSLPLLSPLFSAEPGGEIAAELADRVGEDGDFPVESSPLSAGVFSVESGVGAASPAGVLLPLEVGGRSGKQSFVQLISISSSTVDKVKM